MTIATDPGTPIFDALTHLFRAGELPAHVQPAEPTPCTPERWFGPVSPPVHARHSDTTGVIPGVDEQREKAS